MWLKENQLVQIPYKRQFPWPRQQLMALVFSFEPLQINYQYKKEEEARKAGKGGILEHFGTLIMKPYLRPWDLFS